MITVKFGADDRVTLVLLLVGALSHLCRFYGRSAALGNRVKFRVAAPPPLLSEGALVRAHFPLARRRALGDSSRKWEECFPFPGRDPTGSNPGSSEATLRFSRGHRNLAECKIAERFRQAAF